MVPSRFRAVYIVDTERTGPAEGDRASSRAAPEEKMKPGSLATLFYPFESGALAADDMVDLVACLRRWETDGTWGQAYAG